MEKKWLVFMTLLIISAFAISLAIAKPAAKVAKECRDGIDNDGDGAVDMQDLGCTGPNDNDETNCGDGVCEGGETNLNCVLDCGYPDSCSDTDGGYVLNVQGTTSGYLNGQYYTDTDLCLDTAVLTEFYCISNKEYNNNVNCASLNYTSCSNGRCI